MEINKSFNELGLNTWETFIYKLQRFIWTFWFRRKLGKCFFFFHWKCEMFLFSIIKKWFKSSRSFCMGFWIYLSYYYFIMFCPLDYILLPARLNMCIHSKALNHTSFKTASHLFTTIISTIVWYPAHILLILK